MRSVGLMAVLFETLCYFMGRYKVFCSRLGGAGRLAWRGCGLLPGGIYLPPMNRCTPNHTMQRVRASRLRQSQFERGRPLARTADGGR
jgi:hypothetical protein